MNVTVLMIGKTSESYCRQGIQIYLDRLKHYLNITWTELPDIKERKNLSPRQVKEKEAESIIKKLPSKCTLVILDENGAEYSSTGFAGFIQKQVNSGIKELAFVIGGAYGISEDVRNISDYVISLSRLTFTHQMARLIFAEQLYRAMTIIRNEPYHNE